MKKILSLLALCAALAAPPATAVLQVSADINGFIFNCVDQAACDTNPLVGQLGIANQTFNGVEVLGSSQFQTIGSTNFLNTSSFQIINHNLAPTPVTFAVSGTNFIGPVNFFSASGSGTWQNAIGSTINMSYFGDAGNTQGANTPNDLPGVLLTNVADVALNLADAYSFDDSGAFLAPALHSMSLGATGILAAWNGLQGQEPTLVGRSQTIITQQQVPEPGTLALLSASLLGVGFVTKPKKGTKPTKTKKFPYIFA